MKALVTGGAGFIGSTLVDRLLAEGHAVDVIDDLSTGRLGNLAEARADRSADLRIHQVDITTPDVVDLIARRTPEVVFHLAAIEADDPADEAFTDVVGSLHVLEGARRGGARKVVYTAGTDVYGAPDAGALPVRESHTQEPMTTGGVAMKAVVDYLRLYRERHGVEFTALALATVYGPRQLPARGIVARVARSLLDGAAPAIPGDGAQTRDFLFVDDAVDALVRAADRGGGLLVNVGSGIETPIRELVTTVAEAVGHPEVRPVIEPRPAGDVDRMALDPGRARIHLGWTPWTSLPEGLAQTLQWAAAAAPT